MSVIYELRGRAAAFGELGLNLYSGCAVGCLNCNDPWIRRLTWERWTTGARPQSNILSQLRRDAKRMEGDPREIAVCPSGDPYQSDEAAQLTRKALLILEQYHMRVQIATLCGLRSVQDFDLLARNRWKYSTMILFQSDALRAEWEPGGAPIAERIQALREAHAAGIPTWVKIHPVAYPAQLIEVVESLRAEVDAWKIRKPLPGESLPKAIVGERPGFVDAETALAYLRRMVEKGLGNPLRRMDEMKMWSPDQKNNEKSGDEMMDEE
jgi:DNA repair photolyase